MRDATIPIPDRRSFVPHVIQASRRDTQMPPATSKSSQKLETIKASCMNAPFGEKRAAALKHYYAAEFAHEASNDAKMNKELDAAKRALA